MTRFGRALVLFAIAAIAALQFPAPAPAAPSPAWKLGLSSHPTEFAAGSTTHTEYLLFATNVGSEPTNGSITLAATLPEKITPTSVSSSACNTAQQTVTCEFTSPVYPGEVIGVDVGVHVDPLLQDGSILTAQAQIEGGGASTAQISTATTIGSAIPAFGFLSGQAGLGASLNQASGPPIEDAGAHPYQLTIDVGFPGRKGNTAQNGEPAVIGVDGGVRDLTTYFPRGLIGNPAATPVLCTEVRLESGDCPPESQVGSVDAVTVPLGEATTVQSPLYNLVPPPGAPAAFGFDAVGVGIFVHIIAGLRPGDYTVSAATHDVLSRFANPVLGARVQLWGDPSGPSHDHVRGECGTELLPSEATCPVPVQDSAFLAEPGSCEEAGALGAMADSWGHPGVFASASTPLMDLGGTPLDIQGCSQLDFKPTIQARPTTGEIDSPSGLDFDLHQPQDFHLEDRSTATLRDASIAFPAGLVVNASQADGLEACTGGQIGLETPVGVSPASFSGAPAACLPAAKIGTVEAVSPLLVQHDSEGRALRDAGGNPIADPLPGSVYVAKPFENPFGSLLAVYLVVEDPRTGILIKLAGEVKPDPATGQLTVAFAENPELPVEDVRVHLFGGARASLQTPPTCGTYDTTAVLTPWSSPDGPSAIPTDSFATTASPRGGDCPAAQAQLPSSPALDAGTLSPSAGTYSPLLFRLTREDGTQRIAKIDATLPQGLLARLAGVVQCSPDRLALAEARSHPNDGASELISPSCPADSEVGTVDVGVGAGPSPLYVRGNAYLAGPYRGAPLSLAIVTPAVAGPFDLGVVVVRTALYVDPTTGQARAVSDPLPQILDGIPLDLRSVALKAERPHFTLNPTSCDPLAFTGEAASTIGQSAPFSERFQVGGCASLPYRPTIHTRLFGQTHRGAHPRLRTVFEAKPGEANTARIVFALPRSEFIDQAHFRTICTRVQFAAGQCPAEAVYGHIKALTPLLDYPLEGPIYLRSSSHDLPDVVAVLKGPDSQPIEIDLAGQVDSVNGGIRTSFRMVPDAPVSKAVVTLQGGGKGLFQNSTNICRGSHRAEVKLRGHNAKSRLLRPALKADCRKSHQKKGGR